MSAKGGTPFPCLATTDVCDKMAPSIDAADVNITARWQQRSICFHEALRPGVDDLACDVGGMIRN